MYSHTKKYKSYKIKKHLILALAVVFTILVVLGTFKVTLAFPSVYGTSKIDNLNLIDNPNISWPGYGQSAVGVKGYGVVSSTPNQTARPMASVTKLVTALAVLEKKPLTLGEQGEKITFSTEDQAIYDNYVQKQGVVVNIPPGQDISQYKAMQYTLILSANNIADKIAIWAFGSLDEYTTYANNMLKENGFKTMHVDDASGFSPETVATAEELIKLGELALDNPVIAEIVSQDTVALPSGDERLNTNPFLNYQGNGVIGIKNGLTDEAGGVLLAAAKRSIDNAEVIIITAVMGSQNFFDSQKDAVALIDPTLNALSKPAIISKGTKVGYYTLPWGGEIDVVTTKDIELSKWSNAVNKSYVNLYPILEPKKQGDITGTVEITDTGGNKLYSEVGLTAGIDLPSLEWRIKNPIR